MALPTQQARLGDAVIRNLSRMMECLLLSADQAERWGDY